MRALIFFFAELCLLRRAPQDLPASSGLLGIAAVADLLVGLLLGLVVGLPLWTSFAQGLVDIALPLALLYAALSALKRVPRFQQTATALLGSGALLGMLAVVPLSLLPSGEQTQQSALAAFLFLALIVWSVLVTGHILRHCFDLRLGQGVVVAVAYHLFSVWLVGGMFSGS